MPNQIKPTCITSKNEPLIIKSIYFIHSQNQKIDYIKINNHLKLEYGLILNDFELIQFLDYLKRFDYLILVESVNLNEYSLNPDSSFSLHTRNFNRLNYKLNEDKKPWKN